LQLAISSNPGDARAPYYLGNLLYDRRRHREAIALWEQSARLDPSFSVVWRNLGIGYFNTWETKQKHARRLIKQRMQHPADTQLLTNATSFGDGLENHPSAALWNLKVR